MIVKCHDRQDAHINGMFAVVRVAGSRLTVPRQHRGAYRRPNA
jgi:hypothetical protein